MWAGNFVDCVFIDSDFVDCELDDGELVRGIYTNVCPICTCIL